MNFRLVQFGNAVGLILIGCGATAAGVQRKQVAKAIKPSPLTRHEIETSIETGLGCDFSVGSSTFFVIVEGSAVAKPDGALHHFKLSDDRSLAMINYGGAIGDADWRILIDRDDAAISSGEEATVRNARMTVRGHGSETTLAGRWTCGA